MKFNEKPHFPLTYGDKVENDDTRLSNSVVKVANNKRVQSYLGALAAAFFTLGSYAQPIAAIPPEYGDAASQIIDNANIGQEVPPLGEICAHAEVGNIGNANQAANLHNPIPNAAGQVGQAGRVNFHPQNVRTPIKVPAWRLPGPPMSTSGQYINTVAIIGSVGWICLNASWGNPILAYGCIGVVGGLLNELRKKFI